MKIIRKRGLKGIRIEHNKKLFYIIVLLLVLLVVFVVLAVVLNDEKDDMIIGGDTDEHGCVLMGGYTWCGAKQKCLRTWEEPCDGECVVDSDCVATSCCHAKECVSKSLAPDC